MRSLSGEIITHGHVDPKSPILPTEHASRQAMKDQNCSNSVEKGHEHIDQLCLQYVTATVRILSCPYVRAVPSVRKRSHTLLAAVSLRTYVMICLSWAHWFVNLSFSSCYPMCVGIVRLKHAGWIMHVT